jgi:hypothetical protein
VALTRNQVEAAAADTSAVAAAVARRTRWVVAADISAAVAVARVSGAVAAEACALVALRTSAVVVRTSAAVECVLAVRLTLAQNSRPAIQRQGSGRAICCATQFPCPAFPCAAFGHSTRPEPERGGESQSRGGKVRPKQRSGNLRKQKRQREIESGAECAELSRHVESFE